MSSLLPAPSSSAPASAIHQLQEENSPHLLLALSPRHPLLGGQQRRSTPTTSNSHKQVPFNAGFINNNQTSSSHVSSVSSSPQKRRRLSAEFLHDIDSSVESLMQRTHSEAIPPFQPAVSKSHTAKQRLAKDDLLDGEDDQDDELAAYTLHPSSNAIHATGSSSVFHPPHDTYDRPIKVAAVVDTILIPCSIHPLAAATVSHLQHRFTSAYTHSATFRRWCISEFFTAAIDAPYFQHNEFQELLHSLGYDQVSSLTLRQWQQIRRPFRPRRLSQQFFQSAQQQLATYRNQTRMYHRGHITLSEFDYLPSIAAPPKRLSDRSDVYCLMPYSNNEVTAGRIVHYASNKRENGELYGEYKVQMYDRNVGVRMIADTDVSLHPAFHLQTATALAQRHVQQQQANNQTHTISNSLTADNELHQLQHYMQLVTDRANRIGLNSNEIPTTVQAFHYTTSRHKILLHHLNPHRHPPPPGLKPFGETTFDMQLMATLLNLLDRKALLLQHVMLMHQTVQQSTRLNHGSLYPTSEEVTTQQSEHTDGSPSSPSVSSAAPTSHYYLSTPPTNHPHTNGIKVEPGLEAHSSNQTSSLRDGSMASTAHLSVTERLDILKQRYAWTMMQLERTSRALDSALLQMRLRKLAANQGSYRPLHLFSPLFKVKNPNAIHSVALNDTIPDSRTILTSIAKQAQKLTNGTVEILTREGGIPQNSSLQPYNASGGHTQQLIHRALSLIILLQRCSEDNAHPSDIDLLLESMRPHHSSNLQYWYQLKQTMQAIKVSLSATYNNNRHVMHQSSAYMPQHPP